MKFAVRFHLLEMSEKLYPFSLTDMVAKQDLNKDGTNRHAHMEINGAPALDKDYRQLRNVSRKTSLTQGTSHQFVIKQQVVSAEIIYK